MFTGHQYNRCMECKKEFSRTTSSKLRGKDRRWRTVGSLGSSVMQGYYKMPEETKTALKDGWLCTGDLGYVDEERFIYLTGRKKNLIITKNGENVSPEELENKLSSSRLVQEVLVREAKRCDRGRNISG